MGEVSVTSRERERERCIFPISRGSTLPPFLRVTSSAPRGERDRERDDEKYAVVLREAWFELVATDLKSTLSSFDIKVKVKLSLCLTKYHSMKIYWRNGDIPPRNLHLGTRWMRVFSFTLRPLYPQGESPYYPLGRRLGGPQSRFGHGGEEKNSQPPPGIEP
jgi:hypothetical protein